MSACLYCRQEAGAAGFHPACVPGVAVQAPVDRSAWAAPATPAPSLAPSLGVATQPVAVRVIDVAMPFGSIVVFLVKLSLAAIPALVILALFAAILVATLQAIAHR